MSPIVYFFTAFISENTLFIFSMIFTFICVFAFHFFYSEKRLSSVHNSIFLAILHIFESKNTPSRLMGISSQNRLLKMRKSGRKSKAKLLISCGFSKSDEVGYLRLKVKIKIAFTRLTAQLILRLCTNCKFVILHLFFVFFKLSVLHFFVQKYLGGNMNYQSIFKRYELKYLITYDERERLLSRISDRLKPDGYAHSSIRNVYYDNDSCRLIRRSMEKPDYKEKIRIRSYGRAMPGDIVFVELKKKYDSVVYKRRVALPENCAHRWLIGEGNAGVKSQIENEIDYFVSFYGPLTPKVFLSYERDSYISSEDSRFRLTFDTKVRARLDQLTLDSDTDGVSILPKDKLLMEVKCNGGIPLWLVRALSEQRIYKTSFSKYGAAYTDLIFNTKSYIKGE